MSEPRTLEIRVVVALGPLDSAHDPSSGATFTGYSPVQVGRSVSAAIMQALQAGERIHAYEVGTPEDVTDRAGDPAGMEAPGE